MSNSWFQFKQFIIHQDRCAMKVTTDACLFGGWVSGKISDSKLGPGKILDIGTGTGLLSLMLAQRGLDRIDAIEIDKDAFEQAKDNINQSPWADRINVLQGDAGVFRFAELYDIIISNPPFYEKELMAADSKKNLAFHNQGLLLQDLLHVIKKNLKPSGSFFLLLPFKRNAEINDLMSKQSLDITQTTFVRQSTTHDYFRIMLSGKLSTNDLQPVAVNEISIWDNKQEYSKDFIELLKDYYLNL